MRKMKQGPTVLNVVEHIIIKNFWEYYIVEEKTNTEDVKFALIVGDETELGDVSLEEIKPYIITRTRNLNEVMPAPNWSWV